MIADCDVAIIGGGIVGCMLAYFLAREGTNVCVIEKGVLCGEASGANAGTIHEQIFTSADEEDRVGVDNQASVIPYNLEGAAAWEALERDWGTPCVEIKKTSGLLIMEKDADIERLKYKVKAENRNGGETRMIDRDELREIAPYVTQDATGAVLSKNEGKINILKALPVIWAKMHETGVNTLTHTKVEGIVHEGKSNTIRTNKGLVRCKRLVLAGGGWNKELARMLNWDFPLRTRPIQCVVTEKLPLVVAHTLQHATRRLSLKQNHHGSVVIGGGWPAMVRNPELPPATIPQSIMFAIDTAIRVVPSLAGADVLRSWASYISTPEDEMPAVGPIPGRENCFVVATHIYGITIGPLLAKSLAELMMYKKESPMLALMSPARPALRSKHPETAGDEAPEAILAN